ncbi:MAG: hypothetical protein AB7G48_17380 [Nitrospiraceae bacterium]
MQTGPLGELVRPDIHRLSLVAPSPPLPFAGMKLMRQPRSMVQPVVSPADLRLGPTPEIGDRLILLKSAPDTGTAIRLPQWTASARMDT